MPQILSILLNITSFSAPLLLASTGALFSEYAGRLALFLEGMISFSAFMFFLITTTTKSSVLGFLLTLIICTLFEVLFAFIFEKTKTDIFIAAIGLNLLLSSLPSILSSIIYKTRGVLTSSDFIFPVISTKIFTICITLILVIFAVLFLTKTKQGLYLRITGSDSDVLTARGISIHRCRIKAWGICGFFGAVSGCLLSMRISSFVPNISSGRGWMALAAVFLGNKKPMQMTVMILIFCTADYLSANIQNYFPSIPSALLLALPYLAALVLTIVPKPDDHR